MVLEIGAHHEAILGPAHAARVLQDVGAAQGRRLHLHLHLVLCVPRVLVARFGGVLLHRVVATAAARGLRHEVLHARLDQLIAVRVDPGSVLLLLRRQRGIGRLGGAA